MTAAYRRTIATSAPAIGHCEGRAENICGLIAAGISLAIIAAINGIGGNLSTKFGDINTSLK
jgi:hypothetical protein